MPPRTICFGHEAEGALGTTGAVTTASRDASRARSARTSAADPYRYVRVLRQQLTDQRHHVLRNLFTELGGLA